MLAPALRVHRRRRHPAQLRDLLDLGLEEAVLGEQLARRGNHRGAGLVGHSAGGGEVARYVGRHGESRVAKVILVSAVTPSVLQTDANPAARRRPSSRACRPGWRRTARSSSGPWRRPFYNFDQPGVEPSEPVIANWWCQGMTGGAKAHWDCVSEFINQDWSEDLKKITVPVLAMNGDADQVVPHDTSGPRAVELVQNGTLKTYAGFPHGMLTTHADVLNPRPAGLYPILIVLARENGTRVAPASDHGSLINLKAR